MIRRTVVAAFLCASFVFVGAARAADEPLRPALTAADVPPPEVDWYGLYVQTKKLGWVRQEFAKDGAGFSVSFSMSMDMQALGQPVKIEISERDEFDGTAPFALRAGHLEMNQGGAPQVVDLQRSKDGYAATVTQAGETHAPPVPAVDYTLADALGEELWFRSPRAAGDKARFRSFNLENLQADVDEVTVTSRKESVVAGVPTVFYEASLRSDKRGDEGIVRCDAHGKMLSFVVGNTFEARLEPEETAKKTEKGGDLFVLGMAKIDKPIGDPTKIDRMLLAVDGDGAKKLADGPRQAILRDDKTGAVTLEIGAEFGKDAATPRETDEALAETVALPTKSPQVVALAKQAVGDAKTPREKVDRLVHFVHGYVKGDYASIGSMLTVPEIIARKKGVCREYALLFAALGRAAGVPTREVSGLMYMGDDVKAFGGHAWDEVALDGKWVPVDPTWDETTLDAAHVTIDREGTSMDTVSTLGQFGFRLKDERRAK